MSIIRFIAGLPIFLITARASRIDKETLKGKAPGRLTLRNGKSEQSAGRATSVAIGE
jgi:hypothetical protein